MPKRGDGSSYTYGIGDWVATIRAEMDAIQDRLTVISNALHAIDELRGKPATFELMARNETERIG